MGTLIFVSTYLLAPAFHYIVDRRLKSLYRGIFYALCFVSWGIITIIMMKVMVHNEALSNIILVSCLSWAVSGILSGNNIINGG